MEIQSPYFEQIRDGRKKIEGRKLSLKWRSLAKDQTLWIIRTGFPEERFQVRISDIKTFTPKIGEESVLNRFLTTIGVENLLPGKKTLEEGREVYLSFSTESEINQVGMQAIFMEVL